MEVGVNSIVGQGGFYLLKYALLRWRGLDPNGSKTQKTDRSGASHDGFNWSPIAYQLVILQQATVVGQSSMATSETEVVPVTAIRKLLGKLPSLRRKGSCRKNASPTVPEDDVRATLARSESSPTQTRNPRAHTSSAIDHYSTHCPNAPGRLRRAEVAIQQYDAVHDAIVISTLPCYPFCCHQDLLTMSRPRLLQTAYLFNACLPFSARFTDVEAWSEGKIRRCVERLVGIVSGGAMSEERIGSPLAMHPSRRVVPLEVVVEE